MGRRKRDENHSPPKIGFRKMKKKHTQFWIPKKQR
jgi:hypothetical protein